MSIKVRVRKVILEVFSLKAGIHSGYTYWRNFSEAVNIHENMRNYLIKAVALMVNTELHFIRDIRFNFSSMLL
jgi:hypothetical protein